MFLLTNLVLWGDIANNLLAEARENAGFNATQAQICLLLSGIQDGVRAEPKALTPAEISRALCSPGARVHNQLSILVARKWLVRVGAKVPRADARERLYTLTAVGLERARIYREHLIKANRTFARLLTKKDTEALDRLDTRLAKPIEMGVLHSQAELEDAYANQRVSPPRRWNQ